MKRKKERKEKYLLEHLWFSLLVHYFSVNHASK